MKILTIQELIECKENHAPITIEGSYRFHSKPTYIISVQENTSFGGMVEVENGDQKYEGYRIRKNNKTKTMKTITKSEAIKQGYLLCGYSNNTDWQNLLTISDLEDDDFSKGELVLATKEFETPTIQAEDLSELIGDSIESNWGNDTGDDTEEVFNIINKLDFSRTAEMINKALENVKSYKLTDIVLTNK